MRETGQRTRIKICGLSRPRDIETVNRLGVDYAGFIFWPHSRRAVTAEEARDLRGLLDSHIVPVGVFVDAMPEEIADLAAGGIISMIQLHGGESENYIRQLRQLLEERGAAHTPLMRAFTVRGPADLREAALSTADYVLLDNGKGTGQAFDWSLLREERTERKWFLAGGLTPRNVGSAIRGFRPWAVDLNSGVETEGYKDPVKMEAAVRAVREADL